MNRLIVSIFCSTVLPSVLWGCSGSENGGGIGSGQASCLPVISMSVGERAVWQVELSGRETSSITLEQMDSETIQLLRQNPEITALTLSLDERSTCPSYIANEDMTFSERILVYGNIAFEGIARQHLGLPELELESGQDATPPPVLTDAQCTHGDVGASQEICEGRFVYEEQAFSWRRTKSLSDSLAGLGLLELSVEHGADMVLHIRLTEWNGL